MLFSKVAFISDVRFLATTWDQGVFFSLVGGSGTCGRCVTALTDRFQRRLKKLLTFCEVAVAVAVAFYFFFVSNQYQYVSTNKSEPGKGLISKRVVQDDSC